jgi:hypothetical protein
VLFGHGFFPHHSYTDTSLNWSLRMMWG